MLPEKAIGDGVLVHRTQLENAYLLLLLEIVFASRFHRVYDTLVRRSVWPVKAIFVLIRRPCIRSKNLLPFHHPSYFVLFRGVPTMRVDLDRARFNMVNQQIRPWEVLDHQVLDALERIPRDRFVPSAYRNLAYADTSIPLGHGQATMRPPIEARMIQSLALRPSDMVLEVGTGSGFITALLASFVKHVYSVELYADLLQEAQARLTALGINNVTLEQGDAALGWHGHAPYDVIVLTGSVRDIPNAFLQSLRRGGRLFAIVGTPPVMEAQLITRMEDDAYAREDLFETTLPPLVDSTPSRYFPF